MALICSVFIKILLMFSSRFNSFIVHVLSERKKLKAAGTFLNEKKLLLLRGMFLE